MQKRIYKMRWSFVLLVTLLAIPISAFTAAVVAPTQVLAIGPECPNSEADIFQDGMCVYQMSEDGERCGTGYTQIGGNQCSIQPRTTVNQSNGNTAPTNPEVLNPEPAEQPCRDGDVYNNQRCEYMPENGQPCRAGYSQGGGGTCFIDPRSYPFIGGIGNSQTNLCNGRPCTEEEREARMAYPKCAKIGFGFVHCPVSMKGVRLVSGGCYLQNPKGLTAADRDWKEADCNDPGFNTPVVQCTTGKESSCDRAINCTGADSNTCNIVKVYIDPLIKTLVALVGIGAVLGLIIAGIQYSAATDDAKKVAEARRRITAAILVIIGGALFYAFLNWLTPGGIGK